MDACRCAMRGGRLVRQAARKTRPGLYVPDVRTVPRYGPQGGHQPSDTKYDDTRTATNRAGNSPGKAEESIVRALGTPCRHRRRAGPGLQCWLGVQCTPSPFKPGPRLEEDAAPGTDPQGSPTWSGRCPAQGCRIRQAGQKRSAAKRDAVRRAPKQSWQSFAGIHREAGPRRSRASAIQREAKRKRHADKARRPGRPARGEKS